MENIEKSKQKQTEEIADMNDARIYQLTDKATEKRFNAIMGERKGRFNQVVPCFNVKLMENYTAVVDIDESSVMLIRTLESYRVKFTANLIIGADSKKSGNQSIVLQVVGVYLGRKYEVAGKAFTPTEKDALELNGLIKLIGKVA